MEARPRPGRKATLCQVLGRGRSEAEDPGPETCAGAGPLAAMEGLMKVDLRCESCGCGPERHIRHGACPFYISPLSELELAVELAAVSNELEELHEFKRLVEYAERRFPTMWFGSFSKLRESLRERMNEEREGN